MEVIQDVGMPEDATVTLSNGKTLPVRFSVTAEIDASYDASDDEPFIQEQIKYGVMHSVQLAVTASVPGLSATGSDSTLGCLVGSIADIEELLRDNAMFDEALADLKSTLEFELKALLP